MLTTRDSKMPDERTNDLHLPDLSVTGFRGIEHLSIARLGRVTLLTGRNGVGKTTVLDAVRVYAARGRPIVLHELLERREEFAAALDEDHDRVVVPDYTALFHGRGATQEEPIRIGPIGGGDDLLIAGSPPGDWSPEQRELFADHQAAADVQAVRIVYRKKERLLPSFLAVNDRRAANWSRRRYFRNLQRGLFDDSEWPVIECESLGPGLPSNNRLARFWDNVALTEEEDLSIRALQLIGDGIERVAVVGDDERRYPGDGRRVVVKLKDHSRPVPLKSLGDGVTRVFAAGLALANSRDGFLVVDEAENGIHYSLQPDFWGMILRAAHQNNVQVLETTHSWDCVTGFARAAVQVPDAAGVLIRLEKDGEQVRAVEYSEEDLDAAAEQRIEVR